MGGMVLIGRLHPLLVHFPIGLVLIAAVAELLAMTTGLWDWRVVAVANVRAGAVFAIGAAVTGWRLGASAGIEATTSLEWHRWLGTIAAAAVFGALYLLSLSTQIFFASFGEQSTKGQKLAASLGVSARALALSGTLVSALVLRSGPHNIIIFL